MVGRLREMAVGQILFCKTVTFRSCGVNMLILAGHRADSHLYPLVSIEKTAN